MKRLLLPLLAALILPTAVNAEGYKDMLTRPTRKEINTYKMHNKLLDMTENTAEFVDKKNFKEACRIYRKKNQLLKKNFKDLQKMYPDRYTVALRKKYLGFEDIICSWARP